MKVHVPCKWFHMGPGPPAGRAACADLASARLGDTPGLVARPRRPPVGCGAEAEWPRTPPDALGPS